jgi:phage repressor protein C with HTH and peptisase S24 domain
MRPLFNPGDPLLVDTGITEVKYDSVYFFRIGEEGFIKRLQRVPTENGMIIRALSQNEDYQAFDITSGMDFQVLARVIRIWCGTDF